MSFERIASEVVWQGHIGQVRVERYRHADGEIAGREVVGHPGAVGIVAVDEEHVWLVRQPREVVGEQALLEIPAGKLDVEGEAPLETARRELAEEIGRAAEEWEHLVTFFTSPGFTDEVVHVFLATGLRPAQAESHENERIEVVPWPLARLDEAIAVCRDSKSLIGLLLLERQRR